MQRGFQLRRPVMRRSGFTLIELLAVILIIGVLTALILGVAAVATRASLEARARTDIENIQTGLTRYQMDVGAFPNIDYPANPAFTNLLSTYVPAGVRYTDPWGHEYEYDFIGGSRYKLYSKGADGLTGTPDTDGDNIVAGVH